MFGRLNRPVVAAVVAAAALAAPSAAFACGSGVSAVSVYKECLPSGGGGGGKAKSSGGNSGSSSTPTQSTPSSLPVSQHTKRALKKAGKDGKSLSNLVKRFGAARLLQSRASGLDSSPTAVGSAFDLGSGPTALLIVLAGSAILLLATTGFRSVRQRRS